MSKTVFLFVCCVCFSVVNCQFGFFSRPNSEPRQSPFQFASNIIPNLGNTINGFLRPNQQRPVNNHEERPVYPENENRPVEGEGNKPVSFPQEYPQSPDYMNQETGFDVPNDAVNFDGDNSGQGDVQPTPAIQFIPAAIPPEEITSAPEPPKPETEAPVVFEQEPSAQPDTESRNSFNFENTALFQQPCQTFNNEAGNCINVYSCQPLLDLLKQASNNPAAVQMLRQAHCGFDGNQPKVCCPLPSLQTIPTARPQTSTTPRATPAPVTASPTPATKTAGDFVPLPEPPECGFSNTTLSRVVGGLPAKLGAFPWMALLGYRRGEGAEVMWQCGGTLVSSRHVLTAAHCIYNHENDLYLVRLGELDLAREDDGATPVDILIQRKIMHEQYSSKAFTNDIGLLLLDKDVQYTSLIKPICMPSSSELRARNFEDYNPLIAGWGHVQFRGTAATHLQVLQLPVVSNEYCRTAYRQYKAQKIDERVLCAGFKEGGRDACQGDSGGPLMQPIWNSETLKSYFYQIGVVSFGKKCAEPGFPGVYTRVTAFVPWITEKITGIPQS